MTHADSFIACLDVVAERCDDPMPIVYQTLFQRFPDLEELFILDRGENVRGHMLNEALTSAIDLLGENQFAQTFVASEREFHRGYGVSVEEFEAFYSVVRDVFHDLARDDWTPQMDAAWDELTTRIRRVEF